MNEALRLLRERPEFQMALKSVRMQRPVIPQYRPGKTPEEEQNIVNRIKFETGRQDGFDLLFTFLTGEKP